MKIFNMFKITKYKKPQRIFIVLTAFFVTYAILMTSLITKKYSYNEGDIAKSDIKATRDVVDKYLTEAATKKKVSEVPNQYSERTEVGKDSVENVTALFKKIEVVKDSPGDDIQKISAVRDGREINLTDEEIQVLLSLSRENLKKFQDEIINVLNDVYKGKIEEGKPEDIKDAQVLVDARFNTSNFNKSLREIGKTIAYSHLKPNLFLDKEKTEEMRKQAANDITPVMVKKNQIIIKEGEPINARQIMLLNDLGLLKSSGLDWYVYLTLGILVGLVLFLQFYYLYLYYKDIFNDNSKLILICIVNITSLVLARAFSIISPFLIPLACAPMLFTLLLNYKVSTITSILNCILISGVVSFNLEITLLALLSTILGATFLRKMQQRNDIMISTLYMGILSCVLVFSINMLTSNNIIEIMKNTGLTFLGSILSGVLTIGFLPFFETTFDIVTVVKLLELSNPNHPLLKKILMEAPGTYHHSVMVANLAEMAAEEVGGNPVLARIAAYYHDVGKTKRPFFFKENQMGRENPHDKISPNLSTLIIISHVKDGLELAREYNLPKVIQDVIEQHHGTTLVKYFYITMKNSSEKPEEIKEEDFRYPGPIPSSKESAIIMLADSVEAAVRSINDMTKGKIEEMVNNIIKDKLSCGQLDNCDLTLKDLEKIRKSFLKTLNGIYHSRIEYPALKQ
ncbi:HD family phosphohydrolase [Clostridium polynesiense]|uniref:HD family phosphohydrolase n=1 Tax=Clostridium polynesiense TaxID=1325933 RepID=UPI00058B11B8|nr:HD family phosphohydrolase [Clostridium polynesiense]